MNGTYLPEPVLRVELPNPGGGVRKLGVPTVLDRLVQQAVHQILSPLFDPEFSVRVAFAVIHFFKLPLFYS